VETKQLNFYLRYFALPLMIGLLCGCAPKVLSDNELWEIDDVPAGCSKLDHCEKIDEKFFLQDAIKTARFEQANRDDEILKFVRRIDYPAKSLIKKYFDFLKGQGYQMCGDPAGLGWQKEYSPRFKGVIFSYPFGIWMKGRTQFSIVIRLRMKRLGELDLSELEPDNNLASISVMHLESDKDCVQLQNRQEHW
jgi:hypothetical protein